MTIGDDVWAIRQRRVTLQKGGRRLLRPGEHGTIINVNIDQSFHVYWDEGGHSYHDFLTPYLTTKIEDVVALMLIQ